jgi:hypothetical protein
MRAPPFHGDNVVTIFAKAMKAELRESPAFAQGYGAACRGSARFFPSLLTLGDPPFAQVRALDGQNLFEREDPR